MTQFAGQWGPEEFIDRRGNSTPTAVVTVYELDGVTPATLYADRTKLVGLLNPLPVGVAPGSPGLDLSANGFFFANPGNYVLVGELNGLEVLRTRIVVGLDVVEDIAGNAPNNYRWEQGTPSADWGPVPHRLGYPPAVSAFDSAGTPNDGVIEHVDNDHLWIHFKVPFGGYAVMS